MIIPTQIQNFAVQKIWSREGFELSNAHITIHINSFMNVSAEKTVTIDDFIISPEDIEQSGEISNTNHVHYSNGYPNELGDNKMAVNGLIFNSLFYKYIGTVFHGHETVILGYSYRLLKPLYTNEKYKIVISLPFIDASKGIYRALVKITNNENNLCLFSYIDLNKK
jgi:hydroxyacyl-ACP dehydratase HTD2-like protein with hotdog domain